MICPWSTVLEKLKKKSLRDRLDPLDLLRFEKQAITSFTVLYKLYSTAVTPLKSKVLCRVANLGQEARGSSTPLADASPLPIPVLWCKGVRLVLQNVLKV